MCLRPGPYRLILSHQANLPLLGLRAVSRGWEAHRDQGGWLSCFSQSVRSCLCFLDSWPSLPS